MNPLRRFTRLSRSGLPNRSYTTPKRFTSSRSATMAAQHNTTTNIESTSPENSQNETLPLPAPPSDSPAPTLDVSSGEGVKLDHLGPMVVNRDGTLSRIANWEHMAEIERRNTLRILGKRNQLRLNALKSEEGSGQAKE